MARISTYTVDSSIDGTEFLLGREADGTTKQFSMSALQTFLATTVSDTTTFGTVDINGGAIDGTVIGGSSAAAGSFTTISASSNASITGNATVGGTLGVTGETTMVNANITGTLSFDGGEGDVNTFLGGNGIGSTPTFQTIGLNDLSEVLIEDNSLYIGGSASTRTGLTSSAQFNLAVGVTALDAVTQGDANIAIGHDALGVLQTGTGAVAIGYQAGAAITSATFSPTFLGYQAGNAENGGLGGNTALGHSALASNTEGNFNTAVGYFALNTLNKSGGDTPAQNTAVGHTAGLDVTFGDRGTYVGASAGANVTSANNNTFIGAESGNATTTGADNVAVGFGSLDTNTTSASNTAIGTESLYHSTAAENVAVGYRAGYGVNGQTNSATQNTFVGFEAGTVATTGGVNTAIGYRSLKSNTVGTSNTALGYFSLQANVQGTGSVGIGAHALGQSNPATASNMNNTGVGTSAGQEITTGTNNVIVGANAADEMTTGSGNTIIGFNANPSANTAANQTVIGQGATGHGDNIVVIGNSSVTAIHPGDDNGVNLGSTSYSFHDAHIQGVVHLGEGISSSQNGIDARIRQFDGNECARIHDGGATQSDTDLSAVGYGLGIKMPIMLASADGGDKTVTLTAAQSGSIIQCDADTNNVVFNLPAIDAAEKAGLTYTFVNTTAVDSGHTVTINTNGTDGNDKFLMYGFNGATSITDVAGDTLTIPNSAAIGTVVRITCLASGASNAAEIWLAEVFGASAVTNA